MSRITHRAVLLVFVIAAGLLAGASPAGACENLLSFPGTQTSQYTISSAGVYCLETDFVLAASFTGLIAIEIAASNVVLDLRGHRVGGGAVGASNIVTGIYAFQRTNVTIKNGTVRGFLAGINLEAVTYSASYGNQVEDIRAEGNAIYVDGTGSIVRGNRLVDNRGLLVGIRVRGPGARLLDNDVTGTTQSFVGMSIQAAPGSVVEGNRLSNVLVLGGNGIHVTDSGSWPVVIVGNRLLGWSGGVSTPSATGSCRDNSFANVTTPLSGCTDLGNNN
jgi:hypothetical protein